MPGKNQQADLKVSKLEIKAAASELLNFLKNEEIKSVIDLSERLNSEYGTDNAGDCIKISCVRLGEFSVSYIAEYVSKEKGVLVGIRFNDCPDYSAVTVKSKDVFPDYKQNKEHKNNNILQYKWFGKSDMKEVAEELKRLAGK